MSGRKSGSKSAQDIRSFLMLFYIYEQSINTLLAWVHRNPGHDGKLTQYLRNGGKAREDLKPELTGQWQNTKALDDYRPFPKDLEDFCGRLALNPPPSIKTDNFGGVWRSSGNIARTLGEHLGRLRTARNAVMHGGSVSRTAQSSSTLKLADLIADMATVASLLRPYLPKAAVEELAALRWLDLAEAELAMITLKGILKPEARTLTFAGGAHAFRRAFFGGRLDHDAGPEFSWPPGGEIWVANKPVAARLASKLDKRASNELLETLRIAAKSGFGRSPTTVGWSAFIPVVHEDDACAAPHWRSNRTGAAQPWICFEPG